MENSEETPVKEVKEEKKKKGSFLKSVFSFFLTIAVMAGSYYLFTTVFKKERIILVKEYGEVFYKEEDTSYTQTLTDETEIKNKTFVKTEEGEAQVTLPDNSLISLDKNTEIQINYDKDSTTINQVIGNTWNRIGKTLKKRDYSVSAPSALATVRGTKYWVQVIDISYSNVYVIENKVETSQLQITDSIKRVLYTTTVKKGDYAKVPDPLTGKLEVFEIPDEIKNSAWFRKNIGIDKEFNRRQNEDPLNILKKVFVIKLSLAEGHTNEEVCEQVKYPVLIDMYLDVLKGVGKLDSEKYTFLKRYMSEVSSSCKDGKLTQEEIKRIDNITSGYDLEDFE